MPMAEIPAVMSNPRLLPPGESWTQRCEILMHGTDKGGRPQSLACMTETQGGFEGLKAHIRTVHRTLS